MRYFEDAKEGDTLVCTFFDGDSDKVIATTETTITKLIPREVYFNGDKSPRKVFDCYHTNNKGYSDNVFLEFGCYAVKFNSGNAYQYTLKD